VPFEMLPNELLQYPKLAQFHQLIYLFHRVESLAVIVSTWQVTNREKYDGGD
jgi:hypothetical protein